MTETFECVVCHRQKPVAEQAPLGRWGKLKCVGCHKAGGYYSWASFQAKQAAKPPRGTQARGWESPDGRLFLLPDELTAFQESLAGQRVRMPQAFWREADGLARGAACLRWLIEVRYGATSRETALPYMINSFITTHRLSGWQGAQKLSSYSAFSAAFPDYDILPWEMPEGVPRFYWKQNGATAIRAALIWWLEREGLTAREAMRLSELQKGSIGPRLEAAGLNEITNLGLRACFRLVDPSIPEIPPETGRARWRRLATKQCPWCGVRLHSLSRHAWVHGRSPDEMREELGTQDLEIESLQAWRRSYLKNKPKRRYQVAGQTVLAGDSPLWVRDGLSLAGHWWPSAQPFYTILFDEGALVLTPTRRDGRGARQLHRDKGTRWQWRAPSAFLPALAGCPVERVPEGVRVIIADSELLGRLRYWARHKHQMIARPADMRVNPRRSQMLIQTALWPRAMRYAQVAIRDDGALVVRATNECSPHSYSVYSLARHRDRMVINASSFLRYHRIIIGAWALIERDDREGLLIFGYGGDEWR